MGTIFLLLVPLISLYIRDPSAGVSSGDAVLNLLLVVAGTTVYTLLAVALLHGRVSRIRRVAASGSMPPRPRPMRANAYFAYGLVAWFLLMVHWLKWKESFEALFFSSEMFLVSDVFLMLPFLLPLLLFRAEAMRLFLGLKGTRTPFTRQLSRQMRTMAVLIIPQLLYLNLYRAAISDVPLFARWFDSHPILSFLLAGILLFLLFLLSPYFIRLLFTRVELERYPGGEDLMTEIRKLGERTDTPLARVYVWLTAERKVANAAVSGLFRRQRVVFLTDHLLKVLSPPETIAVVAHEIGHAKFKHLVFNFLLALMTGVFVLWSLVLISPYVDSQEQLGIAVVVLQLCYVVLVFGSFARRFERQADLYGAHAVRDPGLMASALLNLARANHVPMTKSSITHPSIKARIANLSKAFHKQGGDLTGALARARWSNRAAALAMIAALAATVFLFEYLPA